MKVLEHLVADGLHECRRVCHKWKAACSKMGVRLTARSQEDIPALAERFSGASFIGAHFEPPYFDQSDNVAHRCLRRDFFTDLTALKGLKGFALETVDYWAFESSEVTMACLTQLEALEIRMDGELNHIASFYSSLCFLTRLTRLALNTPDVGRLQLNPFTNLTRIKELEVSPCLLFNEDGQLLFPPSENLTQLILGWDPFRGQHRDKIPQAILPYARTLRSLHFGWAPGGLNICANSIVQVLPCFERLVRLDLLYMEREAMSLLEVLGMITRLTSLKVDYSFYIPSQAVAAILCLTNLESLRLIYYTYIDSSVEPAHQISQLTHLTRLEVLGLDLGSSIFSLTKLVELEIFAPLPQDGWIDGALPKLEKVMFDCYFCPVLASNVLSKLENLSQVWIRCFTNAENNRIFETLAALTGLTYLKLLYNNSAENLQQLKQVTVLSNLLRLDLGYFPQFCPCDYILEGTLPRLRYFNLDNNRKLSEETCRELQRRLASLRKITFYEDYWGLD